MDVTTTKTSRSGQALALSRIEAIIKNIEAKMAGPEPENRFKLRFLPTNTDRDLLEPYDPTDMTLFVERCSKKFDRVFIGCSVTQLLTKGLLACLKTGKVNVYMETSLYLLHMADQIQARYKQYLKKFAKVRFIVILFNPKIRFMLKL